MVRKRRRADIRDITAEQMEANEVEVSRNERASYMFFTLNLALIHSHVYSISVYLKVYPFIRSASY